MAEEMQPQKKVAFANRKYTNEERIKKEEEELEQLIAEQKGEAVEQEPQEAEPANAEERSFKKRYGDLRRHMQEKEKEWNERIQALESRKASDTIIPPKTPEEIDEWVKQYPDVAGIFNKIAEEKAKQMCSKAESRLKELDDLQAFNMQDNVEQSQQIKTLGRIGANMPNQEWFAERKDMDVNTITKEILNDDRYGKNLQQNLAPVIAPFLCRC